MGLTCYTNTEGPSTRIIRRYLPRPCIVMIPKIEARTCRIVGYLRHLRAKTGCTQDLWQYHTNQSNYIRSQVCARSAALPVICQPYTNFLQIPNHPYDDPKPTCPLRLKVEVVSENDTFVVLPLAVYLGPRFSRAAQWIAYDPDDDCSFILTEPQDDFRRRDEKT